MPIPPRALRFTCPQCGTSTVMTNNSDVLLTPYPTHCEHCGSKLKTNPLPTITETLIGFAQQLINRNSR